MGKYKLTWRDLTLRDFKIYLFALFKAFIPKKKIWSLDDLEEFIQLLCKILLFILFHTLKIILTIRMLKNVKIFL